MLRSSLILAGKRNVTHVTSYINLAKSTCDIYKPYSNSRLELKSHRFPMFLSIGIITLGSVFLYMNNWYDNKIKDLLPYKDIHSPVIKRLRQGLISLYAKNYNEGIQSFEEALELLGYTPKSLSGHQELKDKNRERLILGILLHLATFHHLNGNDNKYLDILNQLGKFYQDRLTQRNLLPSFDFNVEQSNENLFSLVNRTEGKLLESHHQNATTIYDGKETRKDQIPEELIKLIEINYELGSHYFDYHAQTNTSPNVLRDTEQRLLKSIELIIYWNYLYCKGQEWKLINELSCIMQKLGEFYNWNGRYSESMQVLTFSLQLFQTYYGFHYQKHQSQASAAMITKTRQYIDGWLCKLFSLPTHKPQITEFKKDVAISDFHFIRMILHYDLSFCCYGLKQYKQSLAYAEAALLDLKLVDRRLSELPELKKYKVLTLFQQNLSQKALGLELESKKTFDTALELAKKYGLKDYEKEFIKD